MKIYLDSCIVIYVVERHPFSQPLVVPGLMVKET
jgi:hypothetical protein